MSDRASLKSTSGRSRAAGASVGLVALALCGVVATVLAIQRVRSEANERDTSAAMAATERLTTALQAATSSLQGVDGLAADGEVSPLEFAAFGQGVIPGSSFAALAYAEIVPDAARGSWEQATGLTMFEIDGTGEFVPAGPREHVVVRYVEPQSDLSLSVLGLDIAGDPVRARGVAEALANDAGAIVGPIRLASSQNPGLFVIHRVDADGVAVGFVSSGIAVQALLDRVYAIDHLDGMSLWMDDQVLAEGDSDDGATATFVLAARTFTLRADDGRGTNWLIPGLFAAGTVLLAVGCALSVRRYREQRRRERWMTLRNERLSEFAQQLAGTTTVASVIDVVLASAGGVVGAAHTSLGRSDPADPDKLLVTHGDSTPAEFASSVVLGVHDHLPLTDCARTARPVVVASREACDRTYPHLMNDVVAAGMHAIVCTPMTFGSDQWIGAIRYAWTSPIDQRDLDDIVSTATLIAQTSGRAYERALTGEVLQERVGHLGELTRQLSLSRNRADVESLVSRLLPAVFAIEAATVGAYTPEDGQRVRSYPPPTPSGEYLHLILRADTVWTTTAETLVAAIVDLLAGAWSRAHDQEQAHDVLEQLQKTLLLPAPVIDDLEIAVAYRSAVENIGIGGDWYSVIERPGIVYLVVGDIAGHGPAAIAIMAEVKSIIRHLLTAGVSVAETIENAEAVLQRRRAYASIVVVAYDQHTHDLWYFNAGHPPAIVHDGTSATLLGDVHRPWLGAGGISLEPTRTTLQRGSTVLLYTDGLIEDRRIAIDQTIGDLVATIDELAEQSPTPQDLVERLLANRAIRRTSTTVDDDIAIIAVRRPLADDGVTDVRSSSGSAQPVSS